MNFYDTATTTLGATSKPVELKIPLWWADGTGASTTSAGSTSKAFIQNGSTSTTTSATSSAISLYTVNSNANPNTLYAFEAALSNNNASSTASASLWDITNTASSVQITSSTVNVPGNTSVNTTRSGTFTLTPGHTYAVAIWTTNSSYTTSIVDASLIIFP